MDRARTLQRPNVLLLYTDQQRRDSVGCYGSPFAATPHLDALAAGGRRFERCYVQSPVCVPSRFAFLTGRYCSSTGVGSNGPEFPADLTPVNQLLSPYGYHGAQIGKLHFVPHSNRDHRDPTPSYGFDTCILADEPGCYDDAYTRWVERVAPEQLARIRTALPPAAISGPQDLPDYPAPGRNTHEPYLFEADEDLTHSAFVAAETCRFLERIGDTPFLAIAGFYAPHPPINPPRRFVDLLAGRDLPLPKIGPGEQERPEVAGLDDAGRRRMVRYYHALVSHVDDQIGRILATLEATGLARRTIVIFTSDHGEYLGDHGRIQKGMPHSVITNVPCIVRLPGDPRAGVSGHGGGGADRPDGDDAGLLRGAGAALRAGLLAAAAARRQRHVAQGFRANRGVFGVWHFRQRHAADRPLPVRLRHRRPRAAVRQAGGRRRAARRGGRGALRGRARRAAPPVGRTAAAGALQRPAAGGTLLNQERSPFQGASSCTSSSS